MTSFHFSHLVAACLLALHGAAFAHGGEDHDHDTAAAPTPAAGLTTPQRLADGSLFIPKAIQLNIAKMPRVASAGSQISAATAKTVTSASFLK